MLQHLRMLMGDACDFPWSNVRNFHGIVLSQLEMDRITWGDQDRIGELWQTYVQRGPAATNTPVNNKKTILFAISRWYMHLLNVLRPLFCALTLG